jgi:hypothetical protein
LRAARVVQIRARMRCLLLLTFLTACAMDPGEGDPDLEQEDEPVDTSSLDARRMFAGVNGDWCIESPFNCRFRAPGVSQRVTTASGLDDWGVEPGASIRDGNGDVLAVSTRTRMSFNYGQTRALAGKAHALALSTSNGSAGWYPIERILGETSFRARMGEVNAKDPDEGEMACYEVRNSHDTSKELRKVVYDSNALHERAGDYMSLPRNNGRRSANLIFMVPGFGLGGASTDHFPAGTKFQRVWVPTESGRPSITIPLWVRDGAGRYRKRHGSMRFLYGYITGNGDRRFGWMAQDALRVSSGCP